MVADLLLVLLSIICSFIIVVVLIAFGELYSYGFDTIFLERRGDKVLR